MFRKIFFFFFLFFILTFSNGAQAADFKRDYQVEYWPTEYQSTIFTKVKFTINITNLRSDIYVKKITLVFPREFSIRNISAYDNKGKIEPHVNTDNLKTNLQLEFNDPATGRDTANTFFLEFNQDNLFQKNGNIWEVILPTIDKTGADSYKIILNLPDYNTKKISVSKPTPDEITANRIIWNNPQAKTIYAVFGEKQYYQAELSYHLLNTKIAPVYTDVAFPPDTLYQKIYLESIEPKPDLVFLDEDKNMIGRYFLKPKEKKDVLYKGVIEVFIKPREEIEQAERNLIANQAKYLLGSDKNWQLDEVSEFSQLKTPEQIYNYVTGSLSYGYSRMSKDVKRYGAKEALKHKNSAVCVEFSDIFIALAREKGIYAREIQGYAVSQNHQFRPLSLLSDVLHSWPEYYDSTLGIWIQVDPTWENTSGIDYFHSLDFNHLAFVIHGKKSDYPLPAGMYKLEDTSDISVKAISNHPDEKVQVTLSEINLASTITDKQEYKGDFKIKNEGNVFLWNVPIELNGKNINMLTSNSKIPLIAPYEEKEISFSFNSPAVKRKSYGAISFFILGNKLLEKRIEIYPTFYKTALFASVAILVLSMLFLVIKGALKFTKKRK